MNKLSEGSILHESQEKGPENLEENAVENLDSEKNLAKNKKNSYILEIEKYMPKLDEIKNAFKNINKNQNLMYAVKLSNKNDENLMIADTEFSPSGSLMLESFKKNTDNVHWADGARRFKNNCPELDPENNQRYSAKSYNQNSHSYDQYNTIQKSPKNLFNKIKHDKNAVYQKSIYDKELHKDALYLNSNKETLSYHRMKKIRVDVDNHVPFTQHRQRNPNKKIQKKNDFFSTGTSFYKKLNSEPSNGFSQSNSGYFYRRTTAVGHSKNEIDPDGN